MSRIKPRVIKIKTSLTAKFVRAGVGKNFDAAAETHPVMFRRKRAAIDANLPDGRFRRHSAALKTVNRNSAIFIIVIKTCSGSGDSHQSGFECVGVVGQAV